MAILTTIFSWLAGPIMRWVIMGIVGVGFLAWVRADARAPLNEQITELRQIIVNRERVAEQDRKAAERHAERAKELEDELDKIVQTANADAGACRLSDSERKRLLQLAGSN